MGHLMRLTVACTALRFPGDDIPIVRGSALAALNGDKPDIGHEAIVALMKAVDDYIPDPQRALDKPFSMPVEDVFSIQVHREASLGSQICVSLPLHIM